jgi:hypothetical protein
MRQIFQEDYILDNSGFVIDREGNILTNYIYNDAIFFEIDKKRYYYEDLIDNYQLVYKNIKYYKASKRWKTEVHSTIPIEGNAYFRTKEEAALHVNKLYERYGLDRIPNMVPVLVQHSQFYIPEDGDRYTVHIHNKTKARLIPYRIREYVDYLIEHRELKDNLRFVIADFEEDISIQKLLRGVNCVETIVCHRNKTPYHNPYGLDTYHAEELLEIPATYQNQQREVLAYYLKSNSDERIEY